MARSNTKEKEIQDCEIVDYSQTTYQPVTDPTPEGVHTYLLALEITDDANRGRFRWRLADDCVDPVSGLWVDEPLSREAQRELPVWHSDILVGKFYALHADPVTFFIATRAEIVLSLTDTGFTKAQFYPPFDDELKALDAYKPTWTNDLMKGGRPGVRYDYQNIPTDVNDVRLCADKTACAWRVRIEELHKQDNNHLWEVQDYRGLCNASRLRINETHIFHTGKVRVDSKGFLRLLK